MSSTGADRRERQPDATAGGRPASPRRRSISPGQEGERVGMNGTSENRRSASPNRKDDLDGQVKSNHSPITSTKGEDRDGARGDRRGRDAGDY